MDWRGLSWLLFVLVLVPSLPDSEARRSRGSCGLTCYRWRKCRAVLNISNDGNNRPGERGNTGQLIFTKCDDPPDKCDCEEEAKPKEPPKPRIPRILMEYVDDEAENWLTNFIDLD